MGMGHLHLRKIIKKDTNWIEKNTEKHKHEYNIPYILKAINPNKKNQLLSHFKMCRMQFV